MQAVLITLGALGFGALLISIYVLTAAARRYVHERVEHPRSVHMTRGGTEDRYNPQPEGDRRQKEAGGFPLTLASGEVILADRRRSDRRRTAV